MTSLRPTAGRGRSAAGWLQTFLYRYRAIRWLAAAGAAVAAFSALSSRPPDDGGAADAGEAAKLEQDQTAARLPASTRGVAVPVESTAFLTGDRVDAHAARTGAAVVRAALVVDVAEDEIVVAVPADNVDALVDALTTGGVVLALVPQAAPGGLLTRPAASS